MMTEYARNRPKCFVILVGPLWENKSWSFRLWNHSLASVFSKSYYVLYDIQIEVDDKITCRTNLAENWANHYLSMGRSRRSCRRAHLTGSLRSMTGWPHNDIRHGHLKWRNMLIIFFLYLFIISFYPYIFQVFYSLTSSSLYVRSFQILKSHSYEYMRFQIFILSPCVEEICIWLI